MSDTKTFCEYCHGFTYDDNSGNCKACGGERKSLRGNQQFCAPNQQNEPSEFSDVVLSEAGANFLKVEQGKTLHAGDMVYMNSDGTISSITEMKKDFGVKKARKAISENKLSILEIIRGIV